jgi:uncharacterized membrane protein YeiH
MIMETWTFWIHILGTVAFAATAVLAVAPKGIDLFGATVFGIITAIGGGTIRDMILEVPVFWAADQSYIWIAIVTSVVTFYANALLTKKYINKLVLYVDAIGISLFAIQAVDKVWGLEFALPLGPIVLGIITAIGGGLLRDVLAGRPTLLMARELYAIPVMLGCTLYVTILEFFPEYKIIGSMGSILLIFVIRVAAIEKKISIPNWLLITAKDG